MGAENCQNLEQCTYLRERGADCLPTLFLDTPQLSLLSGTDTPVKFSENEQKTDGSQGCKCGKGMSDCLIHPNTPEKWIASMQDSLAKTLALLESRQVFLREPAQVFTEKSCVLLTLLDPATCSWRMLQQSLITDSEPFSQTWPRWGMTVGGSAYAHPMSEHRITEIGGLCAQFATPNTLDGMPPKSQAALNREATVTRPGRSRPANLRDQVTQMWPTPRANSAMASKITQESAWDKKRFPNLETVCGRSIFPAPIAVGNLNLGELLNLDAQNAGKHSQKYWPTPTAHNAKETNAPSESERNTPTLAAQAGGTLNPDWVEWLMGFPIGYTASNVLVTPKCRSKQQQHGDS